VKPVKTALAVLMDEEKKTSSEEENVFF